MSMMDSYEVTCNNCGRFHVTIDTGHMDCPYCGKRWIIEIRRRKIIDPKNRKNNRMGLQLYFNGCKLESIG